MDYTPGNIEGWQKAVLPGTTVDIRSVGILPDVAVSIGLPHHRLRTVNRVL